MIPGVQGTLGMYGCAIAPGLLLGFLFAFAKVAGPAPVRALLSVYTWAWRGTPLLMQLLVMQFGVPILTGARVNVFGGAVAVFALNMAAYVTEIMRAAIESVDPGQQEACRALCIPYWPMMLRVVIPQSVRIALPPACSEAINLIKDTAMISILSMQDIVRVAYQITTREKTLLPYVYALAIYLALTSALVRVFGALERRFTAHER